MEGVVATVRSCLALRPDDEGLQQALRRLGVKEDGGAYRFALEQLERAIGELERGDAVEA